MKNYTSYSASRKNFFLWLTVLLSIIAAVTRVISIFAYPVLGFWTHVYILLPIVANLIIATRLPRMGSEMFYVTINPVIGYAVCFGIQCLRYGFSIPMKLLCIVLLILLALLYYLTFAGIFKSRLPLIFCLAAYCSLFFIGQYLATFLFYIWSGNQYLFISNLAICLSIVTMTLCPKRLDPSSEGDPYRKRYGDRCDGRLIRSLNPMDTIMNYILVHRVGSNNYIKDRAEITNTIKYIREKRREGYKHFGINHVVIAAYVRICNDYPGVNRFISGQKVYARYDVKVNMAVKKEMTLEAPETIISIAVPANATAIEVYEAFNEQVQAVKNPVLDSNFDDLAKYLNFVPGLFKKLVFGTLRLMDYFGLLPKELTDLSPFHGSLFITSMGSLGIPPVYHHLYDFGNLPVFIAFGNKYTEHQVQEDGSVVTKKYIDFTGDLEDRTCNGFYYAYALKKFKSYFVHPERLDEKPELNEDIY